MLLAYREESIVFAAFARRVGGHHQTVQRCVERALAYGPLVALDDRPRPRQRADNHAAGQGLVGLLGVRQGQGEHGYPHELWTTRLLAAMPREHGPAAGHRCLARLVQGTVLQDSPNREEIKPHKVRYYLECRDAEFEQKMAEVLCVYRKVDVVLKRAGRQVEENRQAGGDRLTYDEKPGIQAIATTSPDLPAVRMASTRPSHVIMNTNAMARSVCWRELICSPARSTPLSRIAIAAESSSNSSEASRCRLSDQHRHQAHPRQSLGPHIQGNRRGLPHARQATSSSPSRPSMAPGSTSSRGLLLQVRPLGPPPHPRDLKAENSRNASWPASSTSTAAPSSTLGPIGSHRPPDMIRTKETLT